MRRKSLGDMHCPVARSLDVVGDPWTLLIVRDAFFGIRRFDQFVQRLGIPRRTLADRLDLLVDAGVFDRQQYQEHPPRFEYRLTPKGRDLRDVIVALVGWGNRWGGFAEPPLHIIDRRSGRTLDPVLVDRETGEELAALDVRAVATDEKGQPID